MRESGPICFCNSPMAIISASRALARASAAACPCADDRRVMLDKVSRPTAMIVNRIIRERVTMSTKPRLAEMARVAFEGFMELMGLGDWGCDRQGFQLLGICFWG